MQAEQPLVVVPRYDDWSSTTLVKEIREELTTPERRAMLSVLEARYDIALAAIDAGAERYDDLHKLVMDGGERVQKLLLDAIEEVRNGC